MFPFFYVFIFFDIKQDEMVKDILKCLNMTMSYAGGGGQAFYFPEVTEECQI